MVRKAHVELDLLPRNVKHCKNQSDGNFPYMSIPFGFSNLSKRIWGQGGRTLNSHGLTDGVSQWNRVH